MNIEQVRITPELAELLADRSAEQCLYDLLNLQKPSYTGALSTYKGVTLLAFEGTSGNCYYAISPSHSTLVAKASSLVDAVEQVQKAIDLLLLVRSLSPHERRINSAVTRAAQGIFASGGKDSVVALAKTLASAYSTDKQSAESCHFLASRVVAECESASDKAREWAAADALKFGIVVCQVELRIEQYLSAKANEDNYNM